MELKDYINFHPHCIVVIGGKNTGYLVSVNNDDTVSVNILGSTIDKRINIADVMPVLKQINNMTEDQVLKLAQIAFSRYKTVTWKITKHDASGYWLEGVDHLNIKYYFRINDYFEIYASTHFEKTATEEAKKYDKTLGNIDTDWKYGVPYIMLTKQLLEWEFDVFHLVRHKLAVSKGEMLSVIA